jgi:hypothetical protein
MSSFEYLEKDFEPIRVTARMVSFLIGGRSRFPEFFAYSK